MYTYSKEHLDFLQKKKRKKHVILFLQIIIIMAFLVIWEILAKLKIINTFLFSCPSEVFKCMISLYKDNNLLMHIGITVYETLISFILANVIGIVVATLLWWNQTFAKVLDPYLTIINSLPKVALGPLIIIWVGASINSIIFMALLINTIISIINIYNGFINTDENFITLLKTFKATKWQLYKKVIIPSNLSNIISNFKINISMSLIGLLPPVGENLSSNKYCSKYLSHYL